MNAKIRNTEEVMMSQRHVLEMTKKEREALSFDFEMYKNKIIKAIDNGKEEAWAGWCEQKKCIDSIKFVVNKQLGFNQQMDVDMKMFQQNYNSSVATMMTRFGDTAYEIEDKVRSLKDNNEHKLIRFADIIIKEFKYLCKLQREDILFTVGYHDKINKKLPPKAGDGEIWNDIMSVGSMPNFQDVKRKLEKKQRPNSYHLFQGQRRKMPQIATIRSSSIKPSDLSSSIIQQSNQPASSDNSSSSKTSKQGGQTPINSELDQANVWTRSFKRMKRAIAASEDNEADRKIDDEIDKFDFIGQENQREKQLAKFQHQVFALRDRPLRQQP